MNRTPTYPGRWAALVSRQGVGWMTHGLCLKVGQPDDWYPKPGHNGKELVEVCDRCPVRQACLDSAMALELNQDGTPMGRVHRIGIRGGLTPNQRAALARDGEAA